MGSFRLTMFLILLQPLGFEMIIVFIVVVTSSSEIIFNEPCSIGGFSAAGRFWLFGRGCCYRQLVSPRGKQAVKSVIPS